MKIMKNLAFFAFLFTFCSQSMLAMSEKQLEKFKKLEEQEKREEEQAATDAAIAQTLTEAEQQAQQLEKDAALARSLAAEQQKNRKPIIQPGKKPMPRLLPPTTASSSRPTQQPKEDKELQKALALSEAKDLKPGVYEKNIAGITVHQLAVEDTDKQVTGLTCGPRAILFAAALDNIVAKPSYVINPITLHNALVSPAIRYDKNIAECVQNYELASTEFRDFIEHHIKKQIDFNRFFVLGRQALTASGSDIIPLPLSEKDTDILNLSDVPSRLVVLQTLLRNTDPDTNEPIIPSIHFICSTGSHWVLFSVINNKRTPILWYIDSLNKDVTIRHFDDYVEYIKKYLGLQK